MLVLIHRKCKLFHIWLNCTQTSEYHDSVTLVLRFQLHELGLPSITIIKVRSIYKSNRPNVNLRSIMSNVDLSWHSPDLPWHADMAKERNHTLRKSNLR